MTIKGLKSPLSDVVIPQKIDGYPVTSIGKMAFSYCVSLDSIEIPSSVTSIGEEVFAYCDNLSNIYVEKGSHAETWAKNNGFSVKYSK